MKTNDSLGRKAFSGFIWSATRRFGDLTVKFLVGIVLARILAPQDFGLIAMVTVFVALGTGIADAGFAAAIIQRQNLSQRDLSTVFFFNVLLAILTAGGIYLAAPYVADFYSQPQLIDILRWLGLSVVLTALGSIHQSQLIKRLEFGRIMVASIPALLLSGGLAIAMAYSGYGVWTLVIQSLLQAGLQMIFLWFASHWRPTIEFSWSSIGSMFPFGSRLAVSGVLNVVFQNIYVLVIGRLFSPVDLAYFQRAHEFKRMGAQNLSGVVESVMFPVYSTIQDDWKRTRSVFGRSIFLLSLLSFPLMGLMAGVAEPLIVLLIGEKWLPAAHYLPWLCLAGALYPIHAANLSILKALGKSAIFLRLEVFKKVAAVAVLIVTYRYGIMAIVYGQVAISFVNVVINSSPNHKIIGYSLSDLSGHCLPAAWIGLVAFAFSRLIAQFFMANPVLALIGGLGGGALLALAASALIRRKLERELAALLGQRSILQRLAFRKKTIKA